MSVYANTRSIIHKGDSGTHPSGPPDVCKTPSPGGPVPIPYPNIAMSSDLSGGTKKVKIEGKSVAHEGSNLKTSTGDEAGTAGGGLMSSKTKGKLTFGTSSPNVKVEGKGVARFMEVTQHNGNTFNTVIVATGAMMPAYGDDPLDGDDCLICGSPKPRHRIDPSPNVIQLAQDLCRNLQRSGGGFATAFVKNSGVALKKGVMIGVLQCRCAGGQPYAGLAGPAWVDGPYLASANAFRAEAQGLGLTPVVTAPAGPPVSGFHPPDGTPGFSRISGVEWAATQARVATAWETHGRANLPLTCAAPKMIQRCLADGHKPEVMIEMWVGMKLGAELRVPRVFGLVSNGAAPPVLVPQWQESVRFESGAPVVSCSTCQVVCTEMLCNLGQPPCP